MGGGEVDVAGLGGEAAVCGRLGEELLGKRDVVMVGCRRKRRSCCQRACCAIRRVVERWERERGYGDGSEGIDARIV